MGVADFPFWIFLGDIHGETANIRRIKDLDKAQGIVVTGDIGKRGTLQETVNVIETLEAYANVLYAQIGNMDSHLADAYLSEKKINLHKKSIEYNALLFMGIGGSLPTPFATKSEFSEEFYAECLQNFALLPKSRTTLLISHNPPFGTQCDRLKNGRHIGSRAVLKFIRDYRPDFCVCGHIHESRAKEKIGSTWVCNLGDFASGYYGKLILSPEPEMELCTIFN